MITLGINQRSASWHYKRIKNILDDSLSRAINQGVTIDKKHKTLTDDEKAILNFFKIDNVLKTIIVGEPDSLIHLIKMFRAIDGEILLKTNRMNRILYDVFITSGYEKKEFNKLGFVNRIGLDTCPYCNRNYIYSLSKKGAIRPEIDHFFPKSKYPFLGLSFYNLIPSCQTCNSSGVKGQKDPIQYDLKSPYEVEQGDFVFGYEIVSADYQIITGYKRGVRVLFEKKLDGNNRVFKLSKLYRKHSDHVQELIIKSEIKYGKKMRKYLNGYSGMTFSKAEMNRLIIGNYSEAYEIHKRPLAKLYRDIALDLKLI